MKVNIHYRLPAFLKQPKSLTSRSAVVVAVCMLSLAAAAAQSTARRARAAQAGSSLSAAIVKLTDHPDVHEAHWGVSVVSVKGGTVIAGLSSDKLFMPASTAKIYPAAAALSLLGPDYKYRTSVYGLLSSDSNDIGVDLSSESKRKPSVSDGELQGDLVLIGRGDPNLSGRVLPISR